jgi:hypothetical protein
MATVAWVSVVTDLAYTAERLAQEHSLEAVVEQRTIRLPQPVRGDPSLTVLRVLGVAQDDTPVGAAAHAGNVVAIGVWREPVIYLARWTNGKRWVTGYRLTGDAKPNTYVRTEGRIPTRLETGSWYGPVPDEVAEAFFEVGLLIDEPPFPIVRTRAPAPKPEATAPARPRAPRTPRAAPAPAPQVQRPPTSRVCPNCGMRRSITQFVADSDLCVDCR